MEPYSLSTEVTEDGEPGYLNRYSDGLQAGWPGFDSRQAQGILPYFT